MFVVLRSRIFSISTKFDFKINHKRILYENICIKIIYFLKLLFKILLFIYYRIEKKELFFVIPEFCNNLYTYDIHMTDTQTYKFTYVGERTEIMLNKLSSKKEASI